jgi:hypothetical protein
MSVSHLSPSVVLPESGLPPVLLIPGVMPAQEARCPGLGKRHVGADLGEDAFSGAPAHAGDRGESVTGSGEREAGLAGVLGDQGLDALVEAGDRRVEVIGVLQAEPDEQGVVSRVVGAEATAQRLAQRRDLLAQRAAGQLGQHLGVAFAGDEGLEHGPAGGAEHVGGDRVQLDSGVFSSAVRAGPTSRSAVHSGTGTGAA